MSYNNTIGQKHVHKLVTKQEIKNVLYKESQVFYNGIVRKVYKAVGDKKATAVLSLN